MTDKSFTTTEGADVVSIQEENINRMRSAILQKYPGVNGEVVDGVILEATRSFTSTADIEDYVERVLKDR